MSEETPRLSRREMRERGLLKPVTTGTSPIEELSQTQELNLRRFSRKELRERSTASTRPWQPSWQLRRAVRVRSRPMSL